MVKKWNESDYGDNNHDIAKFYDSLDGNNRQMLLDWYNREMAIRIDL
jgi:hypothetical protein